jgi:hypothetical protein
MKFRTRSPSHSDTARISTRAATTVPTSIPSRRNLPEEGEIVRTGTEDIKKKSRRPLGTETAVRAVEFGRRSRQGVDARAHESADRSVYGSRGTRASAMILDHGRAIYGYWTRRQKAPFFRGLDLQGAVRATRYGSL